jgi:hypothetical protein
MDGVVRCIVRRVEIAVLQTLVTDGKRKNPDRWPGLGELMALRAVYQLNSVDYPLTDDARLQSSNDYPRSLIIVIVVVVIVFFFVVIV